MGNIFDEIGAPAPANAPVGSAQWQDWAGRQQYLKQLKASLPPGTPLDLPEPVLRAIGGGGQAEQRSLPSFEQSIAALHPYSAIRDPIDLVSPNAQAAQQGVDDFDAMMHYQRLLHGAPAQSYDDTTQTLTAPYPGGHRGGLARGILAASRQRKIRRHHVGALTVAMRRGFRVLSVAVALATAAAYCQSQASAQTAAQHVPAAAEQQVPFDWQTAPGSSIWFIRGSGIQPDTLLIQGEIVRGDAARFVKAAATVLVIEKRLGLRDPDGTDGEPPPLVLLNSLGGDLVEAMAIGRIVRRNFMVTEVPTSHTCASACVFILASGVVRKVDRGAAVVVHRPFFDQSYFAGLQMRDAVDKYNSMLAEADRYLADMGMAPELDQLMKRVPSSSAVALSRRQLVAYGLVGDDPAWAEKRDSDQAKLFGPERWQRIRRCLATVGAESDAAASCYRSN